MTMSKRRQLTAALILGMVFLSSIFALQGSLLTKLIDHYQLTDSLGGLPSSATSIGGFIALFFSLILNGRVSKITLLKLSIGTCVVFLFFLPLAPAFSIFVIFWGVIGIGQGYLDALLSSCMADLYQGSTAKRMMCLLHLTYGLLYMFAPVVYSFLLSVFEKSDILWNRVYPSLALAGFLILVFLFFASRGVSDTSGNNNKDMTQNKISLPLLLELVRIRDGVFLKIMIAMFFHGIFFGGICTWINRYVGQTLQGQLGDIALTFLFLGVTISRLVMSFLNISSERYVCFAGFDAFGVVLTALFFGDPLLMCIAVCICGLLFGAMIPCILTIGSSIVPNNTMLATTLMVLSFYLGQAIGSPLVGTLESIANLHVGIGVCSAFIALTSICCLWARLIHLQPKK